MFELVNLDKYFVLIVRDLRYTIRPIHQLFIIFFVAMVEGSP